MIFRTIFKSTFSLASGNVVKICNKVDNFFVKADVCLFDNKNVNAEKFKKSWPTSR